MKRPALFKLIQILSSDQVEEDGTDRYIFKFRLGEPLFFPCVRTTST